MDVLVVVRALVANSTKVVLCTPVEAVNVGTVCPDVDAGYPIANEKRRTRVTQATLVIFGTVAETVEGVTVLSFVGAAYPVAVVIGGTGVTLGTGVGVTTPAETGPLGASERLTTPATSLHTDGTLATVNAAIDRILETLNSGPTRLCVTSEGLTVFPISHVPNWATSTHETRLQLEYVVVTVLALVLDVVGGQVGLDINALDAPVTWPVLARHESAIDPIARHSSWTTATNEHRAVTQF